MNEKKAVEGAEARWVQAFNRADVETLVSLYTSDVVVMPPGEPELRGRQAVEDWIRRFFERHQAKQTVRNDEVTVSGDLAYLRGRFEVELVQRKGGPFETIRGRHLVIWRKGEEGAWRASRDIWNLV